MMSTLSGPNPFFQDVKGSCKEKTNHVKDSIQHHAKSWKTAALLLTVVVYYGAVVAVFSYGDAGFGVGQSIYFATVMITTVGFGDYLPTTPGLKIATVCLVLIGLSVVVLAFGILQDIVVSVSTARAIGKASQLGLFDTKAMKHHQRNTAILVTFTYIAFLVLGTIVFGHDFDNHLDSDSEQPYLDGFYFSVITITTVGFGDFSPLSDGAMVFCCFYMLFGIPVQLSAFSLVSNLLLREDEEVELRKVRGDLDKDKYSNMSEFVEEMRAEGIGNYRCQGEGQISRFEFLVFILVQNGVVNKSNIHNVMKNFDKLDRSNTGFIGEEDVVTIGDGCLDTGFQLTVGEASFLRTVSDNASAFRAAAADPNATAKAAQTSPAATSEGLEITSI